MTAPASVPGVDLDVAALMALRRLLTRSAMRGRAAAPSSAGASHRRRGRGMETFDVRPWSAGDDIRNLDSKVTARMGAPHVRAFHEERARTILYLVDFRPPMLFGTRRAFRSVAAAEAAVASAWRTLDVQGRAGFAAATASGPQFLGWAANGRALAPLLERLAATHRAALDGADEAPPLAEAMEALDAVAGPAAMTVATGLDAPGANFDAAARRIARRRDLDFLLITDRFERAPPPGLYPFRTREGEEGRLRVARGNGTAATDGRLTRLLAAGARALLIDAGLDPAAMARTLERFDGRSV